MNADPGDSRLVPLGISPTAGLVCMESGWLNPPNRQADVKLDAAQARRITAALSGVVPSKGPSGTVNCPADTGAFAILAFAYPHHPDVGLLWSTTGCGAITNGRIGAWGGASTTFGTFQTVFDDVAGLPGGPRVPGA